MAYEPTHTNVQTLQKISAISRSIASAAGLPLVKPSLPSCPATELHLPPPPAIDDVLESLGVRAPLFAKLSALYRDLAMQLKRASEAKWRGAIHACEQINNQFGMASYDSRTICVLASDMYTSTLHQMMAWIVNTYWSHIHCDRQFVYATSIPRSLSTTSRDWRKLLGESSRQKRRSGKKDRVIIPSRSEVMVSSGARVPLSSPKLCSSDAHLWPGMSERTSAATVCETAPQLNEDVLMRGSDALYAYPSRHIHRSIPTPTFLSSSTDFFQAARDSPATASPSVTVSPERLFSKFSNLSLGKSSLDRTYSPSPDNIPAQSTPPPFTRQDDTPRRKSTCTPRRRVVPSAGGPGHTGSSCPHVLPPSHSSQARQPEPLPSTASFSNHLSTSTSSSRRASSSSAPRSIPRKVAPLPRRQPTSFSESRFPSPPQPTASSVKSDASHSPFQRCLGLISRTPSLVSLTSSRSDSPSPTNDGLDTPPSSPSKHSVSLIPLPPSAKSNTSTSNLLSSTDELNMRLPTRQDAGGPHIGGNYGSGISLKCEEEPFAFTFGR